MTVVVLMVMGNSSDDGGTCDNYGVGDIESSKALIVTLVIIW